MSITAIVLACFGIAAEGWQVQTIPQEVQGSTQAESERLLWPLLAAFNRAAVGWEGVGHCQDNDLKHCIRRRAVGARMQMPPPGRPEPDFYGSGPGSEAKIAREEMFKMTREIVEAKRAGYKFEHYLELTQIKRRERNLVNEQIPMAAFDQAYEEATKPEPDRQLELIRGPRLKAQLALMQGLSSADAETLRRLIKASKDIGWTEERDPNLKWAAQKLDVLEGRSLDDDVQFARPKAKVKKDLAQDLQAQSLLSDFAAVAKAKLEEEEAKDEKVAAGSKSVQEEEAS